MKKNFQISRKQNMMRSAKLIGVTLTVQSDGIKSVYQVKASINLDRCFFHARIQGVDVIWVFYKDYSVQGINPKTEPQAQVTVFSSEEQLPAKR